MINFPPEQLMDHKHRVHNYVMRWARTSDIADDIVSQTMLKAISSPSMFRGDCKVVTWLCSIARREMLMYHRHMKQSRADSTVPIDDVVGELFDISLWEQLVWSERLDQCIAHIKQFKPKRRDALLEFIACDGDYKKVSQSLGISKAATKARIYKARMDLRAVMTCD